MMISRARLRGLPKSTAFAIQNFPQIINSYGKIGGLKSIVRIVFKDVAYRQYDFKSELISIRRAIESLRKFIDVSELELDDFLENQRLIVNLENSSKLHNSLVLYGSDKGGSDNFPRLYSSIIDNMSSRAASI